MSDDVLSRGTLKQMLGWAGANKLPDGWMYLRNGELTTDSECILLSGGGFDDPEDVDRLAETLGYPNSGLDSQTLADVHLSLSRLTDQPSDDNVLRAYQYYADFDAFLPALDAPDPPPIDEVMYRLDREFYTALGDERPGYPCRHDQCARGAVKFSVFCRPHHFESVKKKPSPFDD